VSWPSREDVVRLTRIVVAVIVLASIALGLLSLGLAYFLNDTHFETFLAGFGLDRTPFLVGLFAIILGVTWWVFRQDEKKSY
jgi:hypothetical protein